MSIKEKNIEVLKDRHQRLFDLYLSAGNGEVEPAESKSGKPVFRFRSTYFHSSYRPEEEGARFVSTLPEDVKEVWVFGLGYGWHLFDLIKSEIKVVVVEPSLEIFKSAVENAELSGILEKCEVLVGKDFRERIYSSDLKKAALLAHMPYKRFFEAEFNRLETAFIIRSFLCEKGLRVMLVGPIYGGTETTFRYVRRALENIGAEVLLFDATFFAPSFFKLEELTGNQLHLSQLKTLFSNMLGETVVANADQVKPDMVLAVAQAPLSADAISRLKGLKVPIAFWFVEDFRTLQYWEKVAPHYDYFFTIQRGEFFERLARAGVKNVAYIPQAASPDIHKPVEMSPEERKRYGSDISFMGAGYKNRREFFKGLLDYDFKIWGTEWNLETGVGKLVKNANRRLNPEEYVKIFNASKINLNLHSSNLLSGIDPVGDFVNPRLFELGACGAFQLVDNRAELPVLMEPGKEVETFSSLSELREKIDYYLKHEEERMKIVRAGRERVLEDHTFERRMEDILRIIIENEGENLSRREAAPAAVSRNLVKNIIGEAKDIPELVEFLKDFDPEKPLSMKEITDKIADGKGVLSRVEAILQMIDQITVQK